MNPNDMPEGVQGAITHMIMKQAEKGTILDNQTELMVFCIAWSKGMLEADYDSASEYIKKMRGQLELMETMTNISKAMKAKAGENKNSAQENHDDKCNCTRCKFDRGEFKIGEDLKK